MQNLFENRFLHSKEFHRELTFYSLFRQPVRIFSNILLMLGFLLLLTSLFIADTTYLEFILTVFVLFISVIALVRPVINYYRISDLRWRQDLERNSDAPYIETVVVNDAWVCGFDANGARKFAIQLNNIKHIAKTKHYFLLITKAQLACPLKIDSFTKGNPDDFLLFLRSKGYRC